MSKPASLPFSLRAFLLAPWPVPLVCSALFAFQTPGGKPLMFFFLCLGVSLVISYLGTATLVICLWFVGKVRPISRLLTLGTGVALAAASYLPFIYLSWSSSGPDSGPPDRSLWSYLAESFSSPILIIFLAGGLVAALVYDLLARRRANAAE